MRRFTQLKFLFYSEIVNREYALKKKAERARLHEAIKSVQGKRRMESLLTSIQLQLCFECPDNDKLWWNRICGFRNEMLKTARRYVKEDAEDIVQNALISAHENWNKYREDTNLKGWLCTITKNLAINHRIKEKRKPTLYVGDSQLYDQRLADNLEESFSIIGDINSAMSKLPEGIKSVYDMRLQGHSLKEICNGVGRSMSTVEKRVSRGKRLLSVDLGDYKYSK